MRNLKMVSMVALVICFGSSFCLARMTDPKGPCGADIEKFCKDVQRGGGRIAQCMKQHENDMSQACREQIDADREKAREFINACKPDAEKYCKEIKPGQGRIIRCLRENRDALSARCDAYFKK